MPLRVHDCCPNGARDCSVLITLLSIYFSAHILITVAYNLSHPDDSHGSKMDKVLITLVVVILFLLKFVDNILLVYGIVKNNHKMLVPWLISGYFGYFAMIIGYIVGKEPITIGGWLAIIGLCGLFIINWLYVYELYQKMKETSQRASEMQSPSVENGQNDSGPPYEALEKNSTD